MGSAKIIIDQMTLFRSYVEVADLLPDNETRGEFYGGLAHYALDGEEPKFTSSVCNGYFLLIKPIIDKSNIKRRAGSIGGKAKAKQTESKTEAEAKQTESKGEANRNRNRNINKETSLTRGKETPGAFSLSADESAPLAQSALNPKAVSFKHWTKEQLKNAVNECIASHPEYSGIAADFVDYWYEPTASGKPRLWLQDAWDTCRRLRNGRRKNRGIAWPRGPFSGILQPRNRSRRNGGSSSASKWRRSNGPDDTT